MEETAYSIFQNALSREKEAGTEESIEMLKAKIEEEKNKAIVVQLPIPAEKGGWEVKLPQEFTAQLVCDEEEKEVCVEISVPRKAMLAFRNEERGQKVYWRKFIPLLMGLECGPIFNEDWEFVGQMSLPDCKPCQIFIYYRTEGAWILNRSWPEY